MSAAPFTVRPATTQDARVLAGHRVSMFRDMGRPLDESTGDALLAATVAYLMEAMPRGEYLGWVAEAPSNGVVAGVGTQLRRILPRVLDVGQGLELGPEAIIVNVYVRNDWRRRGVAEALMKALLDSLADRGVRRVVLHASPEGRRLYEKLGFALTNEMRLTARQT